MFANIVRNMCIEEGAYNNLLYLYSSMTYPEKATKSHTTDSSFVYELNSM